MNFAKKKVSLKNQLSVHDFFARKNAPISSSESSIKQREQNENNLNGAHNANPVSTKRTTSSDLFSSNKLSSTFIPSHPPPSSSLLSGGTGTTKKAVGLSSHLEEVCEAPNAGSTNFSMKKGLSRKRIADKSDHETGMTKKVVGFSSLLGGNHEESRTESSSFPLKEGLSKHRRVLSTKNHQDEPSTTTQTENVECKITAPESSSTTNVSEQKRLNFGEIENYSLVNENAPQVVQLNDIEDPDALWPLEDQPEEVKAGEGDADDGAVDFDGVKTKSLVSLRQQFLDEFIICKSDNNECEASKPGGVYATPESQKEMDPKVLSGPLGLCGPAVRKICAQSLVPSKVTFDKVYSIEGVDVRHCKHGVNVIRFDPRGELVAVGSSSGLIRIFDFIDEYQLNERTGGKLSPVLSINAGKDISDIQWTVDTERTDIIVVSFYYHKDICVYFLDEENVQESHGVLRIGTDFIGGGYLSVGFVNPNKVIAGAANGFIRCWNIRRISSTLECRSPIWEVMADDTMHTNVPKSMRRSHSKEVVRVQNIQYENLKEAIVAVTCGGVVSIWDLMKMTAHTLGSQNVPTCVFKMNLWKGIPDENKLRDDYVSAVNPMQRNTSIVAVTMKSGDCYSLNLKMKTVRPIAGNERIPVDEIIDEISGAIVIRGRSDHTVPCILSSPWHFDVAISMKKDGGGRTLQIFDTKLTPTGSLRDACSSSHCAANMTLPGYILNAQRGSKEIYTSHDLTSFLSPFESTSQNNKSNSIYIDWSITAPEEEPWFEDMVSKGYPDTVEAISKHGIRLSKMYTGPEVKSGKPHVNIRMKFLNTSNFPRKYSTYENHISTLPTLLGEFELDETDSYITAIATSNDTPHILVGTKDDSIIAIEPSYINSQRHKLRRERRKLQSKRSVEHTTGSKSAGDCVAIDENRPSDCIHTN